MSVPVIGQPFEIINCTLLPTIRCKCEQGGGLVTLAAIQQAGGWQRMPNTCPSCGKVFSVAQVSINPQGSLQLGIEMSVPIRDPQPALISQ